MVASDGRTGTRAARPCRRARTTASSWGRARPTPVSYTHLGTANTDQIHAYEGLLCNPNPNAHPDGGTFKDLGAYYRPDQVLAIESEGVVSEVTGFPYRLRGVFGFATLSNGLVVTIDVDDWDAPCRRPEPMATPDPAAGPSYGRCV